MNELEMNVIYVDPDQRAIYVAELPEGWAIMTQKGKNAPRRLQSQYYNQVYATREEAANELGLYVANKRYGSGYGEWEVYVNGKRLERFDDIHAMVRGELPAPCAQLPAAAVTLANIEYRIATHIQGAYENLLEVGNCLIEAKESELVPHGEWEAWVRRNTNMSERQAQKLMQAARSVSHGSAMERLPISKIQAILSLPEPEREPMAEKAAKDNMSLRELQEAVKAKQDAEKAKQEAEAAAERYKLAQQISEKRVIKAETELENLKNDIPKLAEQMAVEHMEQIDSEVEELREQLEDAKKNAASGISADAQAKIDALSEQLREAEEEAERQNELRQEAQAEMLRLQTDAARGEDGNEADSLTAADITAAVRAFIGSVGVLPHMAGNVAMLPDKDRQTIEAHIEMVAEWVENARRAMQTVTGDMMIDA